MKNNIQPGLNENDAFETYLFKQRISLFYWNWAKG